MRDIEAILERLVIARKRAGLTQAQAAKLLGCETGGNVSHMESGRNRLTMDLFLTMCDVYGISDVWALTGVNPDFDASPWVELLGSHRQDLDVILETLSMLPGISP